jgi:hypothetical protein
VAGYDAAKQHLALATELRAARVLIEVVRYEHTRNFREPGRPTIKDALADYDQTPKAVLDHQPEPSKETT